MRIFVHRLYREVLNNCFTMMNPYCVVLNKSSHNQVWSDDKHIFPCKMVFAIATWTNNFSIESQKKSVLFWVDIACFSAASRNLSTLTRKPGSHLFYHTSKSSCSPSFRTTIKEKKVKGQIIQIYIQECWFLHFVDYNKQFWL